MATIDTFERLPVAENRALVSPDAPVEIKGGEMLLNKRKPPAIDGMLACNLASRISAVLEFKLDKSLRGIRRSSKRRLLTFSLIGPSHMVGGPS
jgi:hypothetical protein